jgi:CheY-like chemotaxis protein
MSRHHDAPDDAAEPTVPPRDATPVVAFADDTEALGALARRVDHAVRLAWTTEAADVPKLVQRERAGLVILDSSAAGGAAWQVAYAVSELAFPFAPAILLLPRIVTTDVAPTPGAPAGVNLGWVALVPKPFTSEQLTRAVSTAAGRGRGAADDTASMPGVYEVMVIDDDEDSRRVAGRFLRECGVRVREAPDGESGLVEMRLRPPDVVVLDLMMPVLDGFGVLATMRADPLLATIPVVVLTSKSLTDAERHFLARTAVRVLQKGEHRLGDIAALVLRAAASARRSESEARAEVPEGAAPNG